MEVGFVLDLEAPVLKRQELHRCGREAVIPGCFAACTVQRALYLAPIAITRMTCAPSADEQLLIIGPDDESCDSSCVGILIDPASVDRIRPDGRCSEDEWKQPRQSRTAHPSIFFDSMLFVVPVVTHRTARTIAARASLFLEPIACFLSVSMTEGLRALPDPGCSATRAELKGAITGSISSATTFKSSDIHLPQILGFGNVAK